MSMDRRTSSASSSRRSTLESRRARPARGEGRHDENPQVSLAAGQALGRLGITNRSTWIPERRSVQSSPAPRRPPSPVLAPDGVAANAIQRLLHPRRDPPTSLRAAVEVDSVRSFWTTRDPTRRGRPRGVFTYVAPSGASRRPSDSPAGTPRTHRESFGRAPPDCPQRFAWRIRRARDGPT